VFFKQPVHVSAITGLSTNNGHKRVRHFVHTCNTGFIRFKITLPNTLFSLVRRVTTAMTQKYCNSCLSIYFPNWKNKRRWDIHSIAHLNRGCKLKVGPIIHSTWLFPSSLRIAVLVRLQQMSWLILRWRMKRFGSILGFPETFSLSQPSLGCQQMVIKRRRHQGVANGQSKPKSMHASDLPRTKFYTCK